MDNDLSGFETDTLREPSYYEKPLGDRTGYLIKV